MSAPLSFDGLRALLAKDASALAIVDKVQASGGGPGDAAIELINQGHAPGVQTEKTWIAQYRGSSQLQQEFGSEANYVALRRSEQKQRQ